MQPLLPSGSDPTLHLSTGKDGTCTFALSKGVFALPGCDYLVCVESAFKFTCKPQSNKPGQLVQHQLI